MSEQELPPNKRRNEWTGEIEDAPLVHLAPSPADQRKLSADQGDPRPLIQKVREAVETDTSRAINVEVPVQVTPHEDITVAEGTQNVDVPPVNTQLIESGAPIAPIELPQQQTEVRSPNPSPLTEEEEQQLRTTPESKDEPTEVAGTVAPEGHYGNVEDTDVASGDGTGTADDDTAQG